MYVHCKRTFTVYIHYIVNERVAYWDKNFNESGRNGETTSSIALSFIEKLRTIPVKSIACPWDVKPINSESKTWRCLRYWNFSQRRRCPPELINSFPTAICHCNVPRSSANKLSAYYAWQRCSEIFRNRRLYRWINFFMNEIFIFAITFAVNQSDW